jgi:transposase-like protein
MARGGRRDRGKEWFWRRVLRQWRRSGQSVRAFCDEHGLSQPSFYAWRRCIAERDQEARRMPHPQAHTEAAADGRVAAQAIFVPLRVVPNTSAPVAAALEVVLVQGRVLRVAPGFDAATLRQLLAVLEEGPPC